MSASEFICLCDGFALGVSCALSFVTALDWMEERRKDRAALNTAPTQPSKGDK